MVKKITPLLFLITAFYGFFDQAHAMDDPEKCITSKNLERSIVGRSIRDAVKPNQNATYSLSNNGDIIECETIPSETFSKEDYEIFRLTFFSGTSNPEAFQKYKEEISCPFAHAKIITSEGSKIVGAVKYWAEEKEQDETCTNIFIATHPHYQKIGVGKALINHVIAQTQGTSNGIILNSLFDAMGFYKALRFEQGAPYEHKNVYGKATPKESQEFIKKYSNEKSNYV